MKAPVLGSMTSISSTHECAVMGVMRLATAARVATAEECILVSDWFLNGCCWLEIWNKVELRWMMRDG